MNPTPPPHEPPQRRNTTFKGDVLRLVSGTGLAQLIGVLAAPILTVVYYPKCLHEQPVFAALGYQWGDFPEAERASREILSLPMHPFLSERDQDRICTAVWAVGGAKSESESSCVE